MDDSQGDDSVRLGGHRLTNHNRQNRVLFTQDRAVAASEGICGSQLFKLCQSSKVSLCTAQFRSVLLTSHAC